MKISAAGFVQGGMAALSMVAAVSMLGNAFSALKNPDLSAWEKFSSVSMSLVMAIPMLKQSFTDFNATLKISDTLSKALYTTKLLNLGLTQKEIAAMTAE
jgi:hypothetical protein